MCAELNIEHCPTYLYVTATGAFTPDQSRQNLIKIFDACLDAGLSDILLDARAVQLRARLALVQRYVLIEMVSHVAREYRSRGSAPMRLAYVGTESQIDRQRFGETVATNRGFQLKVTDDMAEALAWLGVEGD
jgi:hypothetical protein